MTRPAIYPRSVLMTLDAVGGVWRYAMTLASSLRRQGVQVVFAGFGPPPDATKAAEARRLGRLVWRDLPLDWTAAGDAGLDGVPQAIEALVDRHAIDLVHLNLPSQAARLSVPVPVVAVSHSCIPTWFRAVRKCVPPEEFAWHTSLNARGLGAADVVVAPTASHAALLRRVYGDAGEVVVVPNAVRPRAAAPSTDARFVFAAARWWDEGKNASVLDAAAGKMKLPLLAAGATEGPNGQSFRFRHTTATGEIPAGHARARMATASVVISPSVYEPFGLVALEAASAGRALVLSDIPTYRELWDGCALFVRPDDAAGLAEAVERLVADEAERLRLGQSARHRARTLSPDRQVAAMRDVYARAAARRLFAKGVPA